MTKEPPKKTSPNQPATRQEEDVLLGLVRPDQNLRMQRLVQMEAWFDRQPGRRPALIVHCSAPRRGRHQCGEPIAWIYNTSGGLYLRAEMMPLQEFKAPLLAIAMEFADAGLERTAQRYIDGAGNDPRAVSESLEDPMPGWPGYTVFGCHHHGNIAVPVEMLKAEATSTRRTMRVNCLVGVIPIQ